MSETLEQKTKMEIRRGIELGTNLQDIIEQIEQNVVGKKLSYIDLSYVERKYIHYVMKLWLQEVSEFLQSNPDDENIDIINLINMSDQKLKNLNNFLPKSNIFHRFKDVVLNKEWESKILLRFREICIREISNYEYAIEEIKFVNKIIDVITNSREAYRNFYVLLNNFVKSIINFRELLKNMLNTTCNLEDFDELKTYAEILVDREKYYFEKKIRDCLAIVASAVSIEIKNDMNRTYLELFGGVIYISDSLPKIESKINGNQNITEIHIVSPFAIHIDDSLKTTIWHGKNLVLYSKKIHVSRQIEINVSGNNGSDIEVKGVDGVSPGEDGRDGNDGNCGESGGNVLIMADEICESKNLNITSNGGAGSNGQNGGNGKDGENGVGITKNEMLKSFPTTATASASESYRNADTTINNIKRRCEKPCEVKCVNSRFKDFYVEGESNSGERIVVSEYNFFFTRHAYFLCEGSPGRKGGTGGKFGFGGEGGHEGNIEIFQNQAESNILNQIIVNRTAGSNGKDGIAGICGKPGVDGWDMGYADKLRWGEPYYYGGDQKTKLRVAVDTNGSDSVYCYKNKCYCDIRSCGSIFDTQRDYKQTRNTTQKKQRGINSISNKKKNVSKESIAKNYSSRMNCDLLSDLIGNVRKLSSMTTIVNNLSKKGMETNLPIHNDMRVATYSKEIKPKLKSHTTENSKPITKLKSPISIFYANCNQCDLTSDKLIFSDVITDIVEQIEMIISRLAIDRDNKFLSQAALLYNYALKRQKLLSFNTVDLSQHLNTTIPEYNRNGSKITYKFKYLDLPDTKTSTVKMNLIKKILPYFSDTVSDKQQNATLLTDYIKSLIETKSNDQSVSKNKHYINKFMTCFIYENSEKDYNLFGPCLEYIEKKISDSSKNEDATTTLNSEQEAVGCESTASNDKSNKFWSKENFYKIKKAISDIFSTKKDIDNIDWSQYEFHRDILNAMFTIFSKFGCTLSSYRDLVSFRESISYYFIEINGEYENFVLHNIDSSQEVDPIFMCHNGLGYEARVLNKNYFNLDFNRINACSLTDKILLDIHSLDSNDAINDYLISNRFDSTRIENKKDEICNSDCKFIKFFEKIFEKENIQELLPLLNKISKKYLNAPNLLLLSFHNVFNIESIRVPTDVFKIIISEAIEAYIYDLSTYNSFAWIVSTTDQNDWISEIIFLLIENFCKEDLKGMRKDLIPILKKLDFNIAMYLYEKIKDTALTIVNLGDLTYVIKMLGTTNNFNMKILDEVNLIDWKYIIANEFYKSKLKMVFSSYEEEELLSDGYIISMLCNSFGDPNVCKLFEALALVKNIKHCTEISDLLIKILNGEYELIKCVEHITKEKSLHDLELIFSCENVRDIETIYSIIDNNSNNSISVKVNLESSMLYITHINKNIEMPEHTFYFNKDILTHPMNSIPNSECNMTKSDMTLFPARIKAIQLPLLLIEYKNGRRDFDNFQIDEITSHVNKYRLVYQYLDISKIIYEILSLIDRALQLKRNFKLRDTQKTAIVLMLLNKDNILAQVSTGEGKSLIVTAIAIIKALNGSTVDICTSSTLLAKRDAESEPPKGCKDLYQIFNIPVSHNCSDDVDERKKVYSENLVIYGQISNFQRDYLMDTFHNKNMLGGRKYETIIIDEVDSMLLDKGNNMLYLSHDLPGLDRLEQLYVFLWQIITSNTEYLSGSNVKDMVVNTLFKKIIKNDLHTIDKNLTEYDINKIWSGLYLSGVIDKEGILNIESVQELNEIQFLAKEYEVYMSRIIYFIDTHIKIKPPVTVPNYLIKFVMFHLDRWIENAMIAYLMVEGTDYVVDVDRTRSHPDRYPMITILDRDTGTDLGNSQWDEALHQFLQIKHGCKLSMQKLKAVFISNVSFFKKYEKLYGLTGTLGSKVERELLTEIHHVDFVTIPTSKPRKFKEDVPILCEDSLSWLEELKKMTKSRIGHGQSVLIIFDTIKELKEVESAFKKENTCKELKVYRRDYEEFDLTQGNNILDSGVVILATNLAGRGADIKLTESVVAAGGLHVCLSYLPKNCRIEQQAFGRASRCGEPGSGQLVFIRESNLPFLKLKTERDMEECLRLNSVKLHYQKQIIIEEKYLERFTLVFKKKKDMLDDLKVPGDIKGILLKSCLNKWAFWLDRYSKLIGDKDKHEEIGTSFKTFLDNINSLTYSGPFSELTKHISRLRQFGATATFHLPTSFAVRFDASNMTHLEDRNTNWSHWTDDPIIKVQIAKALFTMKYFDEALDILESVIKSEPHCNELAHYYMSAIYISQIDWTKKKMDSNKNIIFDDDVYSNLFKIMKMHLICSKKKFEDLSQNGLQTCAILNEIKKNNEDQFSSIIEVEGLNKQKETTSQIYGLFIDSIDDILGRTISGQHFVRDDIDSFTGDKIYNSLQCCLNLAVINDDFLEKDLIQIAEKNLLDVINLKNVLKETTKPFQISEFEINLKESLFLPSREDFWEILKNFNFFNNFEELVFLNYKTLKSFDPSLCETLKEKENKKIIIRAKYDEENKPVLFKYNFPICEDSVLFNKDNFIEITNSKRFEFLLNNSVISLNFKAEVDISQERNVVFSRYDSVHERDFATELIPKSDLDYIITTLCENNILRKCCDGGYKLNLIDISSFPNEIVLYQERILRVLKQKFLYRLQIDSIVKQVESKNFPIFISLNTNPYHNLISDLIDSDIITLPHVVEESNEMELIIKQIGSPFITYEEFKSELFEFGLINCEDHFNLLMNELTAKNWIKFSSFHEILRKYYRGSFFPDTKILEIKQIIDQEQFLSKIINRKFHTNKNQVIKIINILGRKELSNNYKEISSTLSLILNNKLDLSSDNIRDHTLNVLQNSKSNLYSVENPVTSLQSIFKLSLGVNFLLEMEKFKLNGCDHTINLHEKNYTWKMFRNIMFCTALGLAQCALGFAVTVYSTGSMTHFGSALISEGIGDIIYAASSLASGHFSWTEYGNHKIMSVAMTAVTFGIAAYLSKGTNVSRYGYEIAGPGYSSNGVDIVTTKGTELINAVGGWQLISTGSKLIAGKLGQAIISSGINYFADNCIKNSLQSLCQKIGSDVLIEMDKIIHEHGIDNAIRELITICDLNVAKSFLITAIKKRFPKGNDNLNEFVKLISKMLSCAHSGIAEASKKISRSSSTSKSSANNFDSYLKIINIISIATKCVLVTTNLVMLRNSVKSILNNIVKDISQKATEEKIKMKINSEKSVDDLDVVHNELLDLLRTEIRSMGGKIVEENLVTPLVNWGSNLATDFTIRAIKSTYNAIRDHMHRTEFEAIKKGLEKELFSSPEKSDFITSKYNENLLKLMKKCRSPELFADIINENVPMDATCVKATLNIICKMQNIKNLSVEIKNSSGESQIFTVGSDLAENVLRIVVDDNHYQGGENIRGNNCLFATLVDRIPELNGITPKEFRNKVANEIVSDPEIRERIEKGQHSFGISKGFIGGGEQHKSIKRSEAKEFDIEIPIKDKEYVKIFKEFGSNKCLQETEVLERVVDICKLLERDEYSVSDKGESRTIFKDSIPVFEITGEMRDWINLKENIGIFETEKINGSECLTYIKCCTLCDKNYTGSTTQGQEERFGQHDKQVDNMTGKSVQVKHAIEHWHNLVNAVPQMPEEDMNFLKNPPKTNDIKRFKDMASHYNLELPSKIYKKVVVYEHPNNSERHTVHKIEHIIGYLAKSKVSDGGLSQRVPRKRSMTPKPSRKSTPKSGPKPSEE
ncbi:hypothetical protein B566_EDAN016610 [Ephemera danica]|nr:hypothetical protein B566_EDAN016610 [Ephemera danica]